MNHLSPAFPRGQRIDPVWHDPALYPIHVTVEVRYQDLDPLNHVNNVAMAALFETARIKANRPMREHFQTATNRTMIISQTLNYLAETHVYPDIDWHIGFGHIGNSSWVQQGLAVQGGKPVACASATLVATHDGASIPIPEALRAALLERRMALPE